MSRRLLFVIVAGLALSGRAESARYVQPPTDGLASWDGLGPLPKRNHVIRLKARKTSDAVASKDSSPTEDELCGTHVAAVLFIFDQSTSAARFMALGHC
jgi:hypothetical protein